MESTIDARSRPGRPVAAVLLLLVYLGLVAVLAGCGEPRPIRASVSADGQQQILEVRAAQALAVRDLLEATGVTLGPLDRVQPDLYVEVSDGLTVTVTRVQEQFETERHVLPFAHQTVRSEAVPEGERRLLQAGSNGEIEIVYQVTLEDGRQVAREEVRREVLRQPVDETVLVGVQGELTSVPISGTIVYLSGGNAWLMRESSDLRRNITGSGDLDGRVFGLSADGSRLLFTRAMAGEGDAPLNSMWMARTSLVGEEPQYLGVLGVVWGEWSPDGRQVAYTTADRSGGVPGWKANNDLWLITLPEEGSGGEPKFEMLLPPTAEIPYAWWGRTFAWSPDGLYLAYAQADGVGLVSVADKSPLPLFSFPVYHTRSDWAWVPSLSWSPDGSLLAFAAHEGDMEGLSPEDSPIFGLGVARVDGTLEVRLEEEVGMWAAPRWSPLQGPGGDLLAYGQAQSPRNSQDSRYELFVVDRDGSNPRHLFPPEGLMGLVAPDLAWSPWGEALLFEYEGNLFLQDVADGHLEQITADGQSTRPRWAR